MDTIQNVLAQVVIPGLLALLVAFLIALAKAWREKIKDERLRAIVDALVKAAEQLYGAGKGAVKRDYVYNQAAVQQLPVKRADLEAAVYDLNAKQPSA